MSKPILIILPGWGGTKTSWQDFINLAQSNFDVRCIELPGFGNEPCPTEVWGVEEYAAFVKRKINGMGIGKKVILAHSFGGQVAAYLVGTNPQICDTLVLSGPAIFRKKHSLRRIIFWPIAKLGALVFKVWPLSKLKEQAQRVLYKAADSPDYSKTSGLLRQIFQKVTTQNMAGYLSKITTPVLVVAGRKDTYVPSGVSKKAATEIPGATFVEFAEGKHGLHQSQPAELLQTIIQFLK